MISRTLGPHTDYRSERLAGVGEAPVSCAELGPRPRPELVRPLSSASLDPPGTRHAAATLSPSQKTNTRAHQPAWRGWRAIGKLSKKQGISNFHSASRSKSRQHKTFPGTVKVKPRGLCGVSSLAGGRIAGPPGGGHPAGAQGQRPAALPLQGRPAHLPQSANRKEPYLSNKTAKIF